MKKLLYFLVVAVIFSIGCKEKPLSIDSSIIDKTKDIFTYKDFKKFHKKKSNVISVHIEKMNAAFIKKNTGKKFVGHIRDGYYKDVYRGSYRVIENKASSFKSGKKNNNFAAKYIITFKSGSNPFPTIDLFVDDVSKIKQNSIIRFEGIIQKIEFDFTTTILLYPVKIL